MEHEDLPGETPRFGMSTQEAAEAMYQLAPALDAAWKQALNNDAWWLIRPYAQTDLILEQYPFLFPFKPFILAWQQVKAERLRRQLSGKGR